MEHENEVSRGGEDQVFLKMGVAQWATLGVTLLYGLGCAIVMHHDAKFLGRMGAYVGTIRPFVVGIVYVIYLLLPIVTLGAPFYFARLQPGVIRKVVAGSVCFAFFVLAVPAAFGTCFPFVTFGLEGQSMSIAQFVVTGRFWSMYWPAADYLLPIQFALIGTVGLYARARRIEDDWARGIRRMPTALFAALVVIGVIGNVGNFDCAVLRNLSQAVGGAAPRVGLMSFRSGARIHAGEDWNCEGDILTPYLLLAEADDALIVSRISLLDAPLSGNQVQVRYVPSIVRKDDVNAFIPLGAVLHYTGHSSEILFPADRDVVRRMDVNLHLRVRSEKEKQLTLLDSSFADSGHAKLAMKLGRTLFIRAQNPVVREDVIDSTNAEIRVTFPSVSYASDLTIGGLCELVTNVMQAAQIQVADLPALQPDVIYDDAKLTIDINVLQRFATPLKAHIDTPTRTVSFGLGSL